MAFLAPAWLALAALAAVPLLLHLLRRRIGARVEFPAVRYLLRAEKEHRQRIRLRNVLLMALRMLVVVLVALAAARPLGRAPGSGHAPVSVAIVLDNSLSTSVVIDGRAMLERLREGARAVLARATDADRLWLVTADGRVRSGTRATLSEALARVEPLAGAGDLPQAVARAGAALSASGMATRRIAVLTDGQATSWRTPVDAGGATASVFAPALPPPANRAVTSVLVSPARWTPGGTIAFRTTGGDSAVYRLALGSTAGRMRTLARGTARAGEEVVVHATPAERGWLVGTVELAPDELRADDTRWFAAWAGDAPRATALPEAGPFVASALAALLQSGRVATGPGVLIAPADGATRLPAILLAPSSAIRAGAANRELARLGIPWRFGASRTGEEEVGGSGLDGVTVTRRLALVPEAGAIAETLAVAGREPWIVAGPQYVLVGSPILPDATNFPLRAAFVPWLVDAVGQRLSGDAGRATIAAPGAAMRPPPDANAFEDGDGRVTTLAPGAMSAPARAGTYFFRRGPERVGALVVNGEPSESDLRRLSIRDLAGRIRGASTRVRDRDATSWAHDVFTGDTRRPLEGPLLLLALLALLAETLITRRAERGSLLGRAA